MNSPAPAEPTVTMRRPNGTVPILQPLGAIRLGDAFRSDCGPIPEGGAARGTAPVMPVEAIPDA